MGEPRPLRRPRQGRGSSKSSSSKPWKVEVSLSDVEPNKSSVVRAAAAASFSFLPSPPKWADMYDEYISTWVKQQTALLIFLSHYYSVILQSKIINHSTPKEINWVHHLVTGTWGKGTKPTFPGKRIPPSLKRHYLLIIYTSTALTVKESPPDLSLVSSGCTHTHAHSLNPAPDNAFPWWFSSLVGISSIGVSLYNVCPSLWQSALQRYYCQITRSRWLSLHSFYFYFYPFLIPFFQFPFNSTLTPCSSFALKANRGWKVWQVVGNQSLSFSLSTGGHFCDLHPHMCAYTYMRVHTHARAHTHTPATQHAQVSVIPRSPKLLNLTQSTKEVGNGG